MSAAAQEWDDEVEAPSARVRPLRSTSATNRASQETPAAEELVSVVVPARNEEQAIVACLDSILAQDWTNIEVLVVDGDSTDRTPEIVEEYAARDPRVHLLRNPRRIIPVSLNVALGRASAR